MSHTAFHLEITSPSGKVSHAFTKVGGGTMTSEKLVKHFKRNRRFEKAARVKITPIDGAHLPLGILNAAGTKPTMDEVKEAEVQVADPMTVEEFNKLDLSPKPGIVP